MKNENLDGTQPGDDVVGKLTDGLETDGRGADGLGPVDVELFAKRPEGIEVLEAEYLEDAEDEESGGLTDEVLAALDISDDEKEFLTDVRDMPEPEDTEAAARRAEAEARVAEIYAEILTRAPEHKVQPSTQRVQDCLDMLGNPERSYRAIHITGTNGKTSTARMMEALLREKGLRTGRFTSPHLNSVRERISIDGDAISPEDFVQTYEEVIPFIEMVDAASAATGGARMSFFEVFTVMAFSAFAMAPVDVAVVEVGMGGQWDATNVIEADVAVLMTVAADHEKWLGSALTDIATEKLGILYPGKTLVCADQTPEVEALVDEAVARNKATLVHYGRGLEVLERTPAVGGQVMTIRTPAAVYEEVPLAMFGEYQSRNAAMALAAVEAFFGGGALGAEVVESALMATTSPGRLEVAKNSPTIIIDAAHNPAGAVASRDALLEFTTGRLVGVFAAMADKDVEGILGVLEPILASIVVTGMDTVRAMDVDELAAIAVKVFGPDRVEIEENLANAIDLAVDLAESDNDDPMVSPAVVVMGSIHLAADARAVLGRATPDNA